MSSSAAPSVVDHHKVGLPRPLNCPIAVLDNVRQFIAAPVRECHKVLDASVTGLDLAEARHEAEPSTGGMDP